MNILYISRLSGNLFAGPNYSVPAQTKAQAKIDRVFWYNVNTVKRDEWTKDGLDCKNLSDYPSGRLKDLPSPFNKPDLAVVEEFYCHPFSKIIHDLQTEKIPYVIIPRSQLTKQGQQKKPLKKAIGNLLYFKNMARKAAAIQYLSQQECDDSGKGWNNNVSLIIPNGTDLKEAYKKEFSKNAIKAVYIGRYEQYQKGLDILLDAIEKTKDELRAAGFTLNMYGVNQEGTVDALQQKINQFGIDDLVYLNDAAYGKEKEKVLLESDVFVMTSRFEGLPMGMIEALSYGLPCIATVGTNLSSEIGEYDAGWPAENTVDSVADAFKTMIAQYDDMNKKSENARRLSRIFSWDAIAEKSHDEYVKVLEGCIL